MDRSGSTCAARQSRAPLRGHLRSAVVYDQLWRWLEAGHGLEVTMIRNVTDIDDKILQRSSANRMPWWAWAATYESEFREAYASLGIRRPTYEPRATSHVPQILAMIDQLIEQGYAYRATDGSSDVYFDVSPDRSRGCGVIGA